MYRYPYGDTQQLNLDWFLDEFRNLQAAWEQEKAGIDGALDAEIAKAEAALADVFAARDAAAASASSAAQSAQEAGGYLDTVEADATAARNAASNANKEANAANGSAQNAAQSALNALNAQNAAGNSATAASGSASAAADSSTAAAGSASAAADSATAAAGSASAAADSATAAAGSAEEAETAAESVSESAAQITQNADDIADLKNANDLNSVVGMPCFITPYNYDIFQSGNLKITKLGNSFHLKGVRSSSQRYFDISNSIMGDNEILTEGNEYISVKNGFLVFFGKGTSTLVNVKQNGGQNAFSIDTPTTAFPDVCQNQTIRYRIEAGNSYRCLFYLNSTSEYNSDVGIMFIPDFPNNALALALENN